jgi:hypothetical protein
MTFPSQTDSLSAELPIPPAGAGLDGCSYRLPGRPTSNPIQLGLTTLPLVREQEPNDQLTGAPLVELPVEIAGQFERPGDQDVFRFHAQAGQTLWLDAIADRQGGRADPVLIVQRITTCPSGEEQIAALASADDDGRSLNQHAFDTRSADPQLRVDIREDGWYQALLRDRYWESRGGPEFCYRLRIHAGAPDFRVVAVPGAPQQSQIAPLSLRRGDRQAITFYAFRRDGFDGPISITPVNLPAGIACEEVQIDPGAALGTAILSAAEDAVPGPAELQFRATAPGPEGGLLSHPVRGATVLWGAQGVSPALCRVVDHLTLAVMHEAAPWQLAGGTKEIQAWQGSSAVLPVSLQRRGDCQDAVRLHVQNLPEQASIDGPAVIPREVAAGEVRLAVRETAPPGRYQLLVQGEADVSYRRNPQAAERAQARHEQARQRADQLRLEAEEASKRKNESQRLLSLAQRAVQQTQAALGQSAQQLDQARQQAGKADMASRQTGQTLAAAEQQLALANQKLSAAEARRRTGDDAFAPLEAAAQQADRTVADLRAEIAELQAAAQKLETEPPPSGTDESASAADKTNSPLDAAQARLPDLLETQRLARQRRDDMKPGWTAARAEFDAASKEQSSAMGAHDEAFRIHEAARQAAALQQQALLTADQAHRVALQAFNQAQGEAMAAERVRLKSEADEKSAWASAHAAEETRRLARQQANDAAQAAEPRHLVFAAPGASIALTILAAPLRLTAEADQDGSVQQGASLAVRVRLERQPSFDQPVLLTLAGAEAEGRISAPAVFVPSGDREATLLIRVAPEAAPGPYPNCVIRAVLDPATGTGVEAPVCLQVRSAAPTRPVETSQRTE